MLRYKMFSSLAPLQAHMLQESEINLKLHHVHQQINWHCSRVDKKNNQITRRNKKGNEKLNPHCHIQVIIWKFNPKCHVNINRNMEKLLCSLEQRKSNMLQLTRYFVWNQMEPIVKNCKTLLGKPHRCRLFPSHKKWTHLQRQMGGTKQWLSKNLWLHH
jgi:hypothetical protein